MIIYGAVIIPILVCIYLLMYHRDATKWWEILLLFGICVPVIFGAKYLAEGAQTRDIEFWGSLAKKALHDEPWDEYVHQTCTRTVSCGKDCTTTESYDCSYVDEHPRWCRFKTTIPGETIDISYTDYKKVVKFWGGKEVFTDMKRDYHWDDGDRYHVSWIGGEPKAIPITTKHSWENRVQASSDVFNYPEVTEDEIKRHALYQYPTLRGYTSRVILGLKDPAEKKFRYLNGFYGPKKRIRLWVLIFHGKTEEAAKYQEALWKGSNKNEFVIAIGLEKGTKNVQWANVISWIEDSRLKIETRDFLIEQGELDLMGLAAFLEKSIIPTFKKRDFREFNYLTVSPSGLSIALSYLAVLIVNLLTAWWVVANEHRERRGYRRRY